MANTALLMKQKHGLNCVKKTKRKSFAKDSTWHT